MEWRTGLGFGVFTGETGFGDRPSEIYRSPTRAALRIQQLLADLAGGVPARPPRFRDVRALVGVRQEQLAEQMQIRQAAVSKFEARLDMKLSTAAAYIAALGGRVELRAVFPDFETRIAIPDTGPADTDPDL